MTKIIIPKTAPVEQLRQATEREYAQCNELLLVNSSTDGYTRPTGRRTADRVRTRGLQIAGEFSVLLPADFPLQGLQSINSVRDQLRLLGNAKGASVSRINATVAELDQVIGTGVGQVYVIFKGKAEAEAETNATETPGTAAYMAIQFLKDDLNAKAQDHKRGRQNAFAQGQQGLDQLMEENRQLRDAVSVLSDKVRVLQGQLPDGGAPSPAHPGHGHGKLGTTTNGAASRRGQRR